eukprot:COSAG03_NODE_185_length_10940_cov_3.045383_4_plen_60_part_00
MGRKGKRNATTDTKRCHINSLEKLRAHAAKVQTQSTQCRVVVVWVTNIVTGLARSSVFA